jgi:hypothetical protein
VTTVSLGGVAAAHGYPAPSVVFEYAPELLDQSGRGRLTLEHLPGPPAGGGNYLAVARSRATGLNALVA